MNRRSFLTGLIAAPIVVRSGVLMPLRGIVMEKPVYWVAGTRGIVTASGTRLFIGTACSFLLPDDWTEIGTVESFAPAIGFNPCIGAQS